MRKLITWFIDNPIAANLLMLALLVGGWYGAQKIHKEVMPTYAESRIIVSMSYPGASASDVERQIVVRIEEAIADLPGIFQITSESYFGFGRVNIALIHGYDVKTLLSDIKARVDAINTFPRSAERPIISQYIQRDTLMYIAMSGDADLALMKNLAYQMRDEMSLLEGVSTVNITGLKNDEVAIEIPELQLQRFHLSFDEVAQAIRKSSFNSPAGIIQSEHGDLQIQTQAQAYVGDDFRKIVIRSNADGSQLLLGDIAQVQDGFAEQKTEFFIDGKPGFNLEVKISDVPKLFQGTENARRYVEEFKRLLPEGIKLNISFEMKTIFDSRFDLLKDNALGGLILVFLILMLFLRPLLAIWVVTGIVTCFAATVWLLPAFGISLNMLSMFAFLMVLGIVVDDAIIVGESIYSHQHAGEEGRLGALAGTMSVLKPVFLAVISTIIFFFPMIDVPPEIEPYTKSIFFVVLLCLGFSLIESIFILPSHLSHMKPEKPSRIKILRKIEIIRHHFASGMEHFAKRIYQPFLYRLLHNRISTYIVFAVLFFLSVAIFQAGWVKTSFWPNVPQPFIFVNVGYPEGTEFSRVKAMSDFIVMQTEKLRDDEALLAENDNLPFIREINRTLNNNHIAIFVGLTDSEQRSVSPQLVSDRLSELIGPIPEAQSFSLNSSMATSGPEISLNLTLFSNDREVQREALSIITQALASYTGVTNIRSDLDSEKAEVNLHLKEHAQKLGLSMNDISSQIRQGFYGEEVQRIPRSREDVRVMLRYPAEERRTLDSFDQIKILSDNGDAIPLHEVADLELMPGINSIRRVDRRRNILITAKVQEGHDANHIVNTLLEQHLNSWKQQFKGLTLTRGGNLKAQARFGDNFATNFIKVFILSLALFAIAFRSLFQPLLILLALPFGFVGAIWGHLLMGYNISIMSFFGFLAASGVVVNDNLVLIERINQLRERGSSTFEAVLNAGVDRFRPIVLTSATTFVGLLPILFERSVQAQFLTPMVASLCFGVLFSSFVTLLLVPCAYCSGYSAGEFLKGVWSRLKNYIGKKQQNRESPDTPFVD